MAGEDLYGALAGLNYDPMETGYGLGQQALVTAAPLLMNPYASTGSNLGVALGTALVSGLLGYQARQQAAEDSLMANRLGLQLLEAASPQARLGIIEGAPDSDMQSKLLAVNTRLAAQQAMSKALVDQEVAKQTGLAEFQLGPLGTKLYERDLQKARDLATIRVANAGGAGTTGKPGGDWWSSIPTAQKTKFTSALGFSDELKALAKQFRNLDANAVQLQAGSLVPGSPADLAISKMKSLVPSTARLLGEVGNLAQEEQQRLIDSTLGSELSGSQSIAARLEQLEKTAKDVVTKQMQAYQTVSASGADALLQQIVTPPQTKMSPEIAAKIAAINQALSKPGVTPATKAALLAKKNELQGSAE